MRTTKAAHDPKVELMRGIELFRGCSDGELRSLARAFDAVELPAGHVLTREGGPGVEAFVLATGSAEVVIDGDPIASLGPGSVVGEMALVDRGRRTATVTLTSSATVLVADPRRFRSVLTEVPRVAHNVLESLSLRLRRIEGSAPVI